MPGPADGECMPALVIRAAGHLGLAATELVLKRLFLYILEEICQYRAGFIRRRLSKCTRGGSWGRRSAAAASREYRVSSENYTDAKSHTNVHDGKIDFICKKAFARQEKVGSGM